MYINLLTQIKNAQAVKQENLKVHYSKMAESVVDLLVKNNYLKTYEKKGRGSKKVLDIKLRYNEGRGAISGVKLISKPSRRIYVGYRDIKSVKSGYGLGVLSTPRGIITNKEAKKMKVGGQVLFEIW